ncbi:MAG: NUDIX hydrolase [Anaerolineae bacterium]|nr:NUDIX hydrolase [Anaerolineae bacterium]
MKNTPILEKPNAQKAGWGKAKVTYPYTHPMFKVRTDYVSRPDGAEIEFSYIEAEIAVIIVPVTVSKEIVLIRQFRYTVDEWGWELPAGGSHDFNGDDLAELARQELIEEIGGTAEEIRPIDTFHIGAGILKQQFAIYLATGVKLGTNHPEPGELIEVHPIPAEKALEMAHNGEIQNGSCAYALLRCESQIRQILNDY